MILLNTKFQKRKCKMWTFIYPNNEKAQLDYILLNKKWKNSAQNCEAYNTFCTVGSDHRIVTAEIKLKLRANKINQQQPKYNWAKLNEDTDIKEKYTLEVQNRFSILNAEENTQSAESIYQSITRAHEAAAKETIPLKPKTKKQSPWEDQEINHLRSAVKNKQEIYMKETTTKNKAYVKNHWRSWRIPMTKERKKEYIEGKIWKNQRKPKQSKHQAKTQ